MQIDNAESVHQSVSDYYGKVLHQTSDLKTNACCTGKDIPRHIKQALSKIHEEILSSYYGCGLVAPAVLEGTRVLDLGCGTGRDCYVLSKLVGPNGHVVGVDMTKEQLDRAQKYVDYQKEAFGYEKSNVEFKLGLIEELDKLGLAENSFDIIVSNCVVNLCPDKEAVLRQAYRVLKSGGEMYFSDVYADRRVPKELQEDPVLFGECLSGALYWNDFVNLAKKVGFTDPRVVESAPVTVNNSKIEAKIGDIKFYSVTYRLFKIKELEPDCEDYGQAVIYKGTILPEFPTSFKLDAHHVMQKGKVFPVCGNTYLMLKNTRFAPHFEFIGNFSTHYGIFEGCGKNMPFSNQTQDASDSSCVTNSSCC
jgi:SAM-dependent methyltransferase